MQIKKIKSSSDSTQIEIDEISPKIRGSIPDRGKLSFLQEYHLLSSEISSRILSFCLYFLPHYTVVVKLYCTLLYTLFSQDFTFLSRCGVF